MAHLLLTDVVTFKDPFKPRADRIKYWADGGLVHMENQVTGEYLTMTVFKAALHLKGINDMVGNSRSGKGWNTPGEMMAYRNFVDQMIELMQKARQQGMPDDVNHARQKLDALKAKRSSRVVVPANIGGANW